MNRGVMQAWTRSLLLPIALVAVLVGCNQGEGDVCQIDKDCSEGLECNAGTRRCQRPGSQGGIDAATNTAATIDYGVEELDEDERALDDTAVDEL